MEQVAELRVLPTSLMLGGVLIGLGIILFLSLKWLSQKKRSVSSTAEPTWAVIQLAVAALGVGLVVWGGGVVARVIAPYL